MTCWALVEEVDRIELEIAFDWELLLVIDIEEDWPRFVKEFDRGNDVRERSVEWRVLLKAVSAAADVVEGE